MAMNRLERTEKKKNWKLPFGEEDARAMHARVPRAREKNKIRARQANRTPNLCFFPVALPTELLLNPHFVISNIFI